VKLFTRQTRSEAWRELNRRVAEDLASESSEIKPPRWLHRLPNLRKVQITRFRPRSLKEKAG